MNNRKCMNLCVVAYKLKDSDTVVINKSQIKNAKEEDFEEVSLFIPESFIEEKYKRMKDSFLNENEDEEL